MTEPADRPSSFNQLLQAAREDFREVRREEGVFTAVGRTTLALTVLPYQLGGAESTISFAAANTYDVTHNPFATGLAAGGTSLLIETGLTLAVTSCMRSLPRTATTYEDIKYEGQTPPEVVTSGKTGAKIRNGLSAVAFTMALGSPGNVLRSFVSNPEKDVSVHRAQGLKAAGALAVANATIATAVTGGLDAFVKPQYTEDVIKVLENPLTYGIVLSGLGGLRLLGYLRKRLSRKK